MTRLVLYMTLGLLTTALGWTWDSWEFWSVMGLFISSDYLSRQQGYEQGIVSGMSAYCRATEQQRRDSDKIIKDNS